MVLGSNTELTMLRLDLDTAAKTTGADTVPESYEITGVNCTRGQMFVGRPSGAANQDALCVCLNNNTVNRFYCFNP